MPFSTPHAGSNWLFVDIGDGRSAYCLHNGCNTVGIMATSLPHFSERKTGLREIAVRSTKNPSPPITPPGQPPENPALGPGTPQRLAMAPPLWPAPRSSICSDAAPCAVTVVPPFLDYGLARLWIPSGSVWVMNVCPRK